MEAVITTEDLRKSFRGRKGTVEAVQGVSFEVGRGEIFGSPGMNVGARGEPAGGDPLRDWAGRPLTVA